MPENAFATDLNEGMRYLGEVLRLRMAMAFGNAPQNGSLDKLPPPSFSDRGSALSEFIQAYELDRREVIVLLLALAPHVQPGLLDAVLVETLPRAGDYPNLGGTRGTQFRGFLPTGETVQFLLGGDDIEHRLAVQQLLAEDRFLAGSRSVWLEQPQPGEPRMSGRLVISHDLVDLFTTGHFARPRFSLDFPAQYLSTEMDWDDLVLGESTMAQIRELQEWIRHGDTLLYDWGLGRKLKPGFRALFHGPPGTGKTLTASLLGKYTGHDVFRVDLSMVVSKFIGETEKNLSQLFDRAENKEWILFFDEADALFSKRTNVRDAHDKYANQEVAYLLQRVEGYNGLVILASNFKANIDEAFLRRFQSVIQFPVPRPQERLRIWQKGFPDAVSLDGVDLESIARRHEMSGAGIMNVVQYCCLSALSRGDAIVRHEDLEAGIRREYSKEGKVQ